MRVRVRFFAGTREAVGTPRQDVVLPENATVDDLFAHVANDHPRLAPYHAHALFARNGGFVLPTALLADGDEVAIMPPVSGGAGHIDAAPFSLDALTAATKTAGAGAVVTFTGLVRPTSGGASTARVTSLTFEAYLPLAEQALESVRTDAIAKFALIDATLRHRIGTLETGEPIVAVVVSARHRAEAFEAAAWMMTELKTRVPIWKQEVDESGERRWINDPTPQDVS